MQDTVCVSGGEVLRVHALAEGELTGERPLGSLGNDDLLALPVGGGALGATGPCGAETGGDAARRRPYAQLSGRTGQPTSEPRR